MCQQIASRVHKFEQAGLGIAPFSFIGQSESVYVACHGAPVQPGTSCDFCGTAIRYVFTIQSTDGKVSKVGSECIRKSGDAGLIRVVSDADAAKRRAVNAKRRQQRQAQRIADEAADKALCLATDLSMFASETHPNSHHAADGKTMEDWAVWMRDNRYWSALAIQIRNRIGVK